MALKRFADYAKDFNRVDEKQLSMPVLNNLKSIENKTKETPLVESTISDKIKIKDLKTKTKVETIPSPKKVNENSFLVGSDYKVKIVIDVPQALVQEYINKVKEETDKDPLDNFSEAEIAEQIISFVIKQNLSIDNLTPEFTVGSEDVGSTEKSQSNLKNDAEELSNDLGVDNASEDDGSDGEIEFKDYNETDSDNKETVSDDEKSDGEIEFDDNESNNTKKSNLGEEREVDDTESDPDSNFDEIEFDDNDTENTNKPKTIGDFKKSQGQKVEKKHKEEDETSTEEEEEIEDMYKKIGYKVGYYESINFDNLRKL